MNGSQDRSLGGLVLAHRNSALRICLSVVAAIEAGAIVVIVPAWTPGRAAFAGVALGLGALAALTAVVLMGTRRPIGNVLRAVMAIALFGSWLGPTEAAMMEDPTQARIPDLELSVTCSVSPDMQSVVATAEFRGQRLDLGPGLAAAPGIDSLAVYAELPEAIRNELDMPLQAGGPRGLVGGGGSGTGYWSIDDRLDSMTLNGRPSQRWAAPAGPETGLSMAWSPGMQSWTQVTIKNAELQAGARYGATWTFLRNPDAPQLTLDKLLPIFMVEYRHLDRFAVQAFGPCGNSSRSWPNRSTDWRGY
jgi:hypothetical protein